MNTPIDVIRENTRHIISRLYTLFSEQGQQDDTEYIRTIRAVVEAAVDFAASQQTIEPAAKQLQEELIAFSQQIWLAPLLEKRSREGLSVDADQAAYYAYYYRYIYENDQYPR